MFLEFTAAYIAGRTGAGRISGSFLRFGYFPIQEQISACCDLHAARLYVDICLLLLADRLELLLQNECHDDTCYNANNQGNYQVLACIKWVTVQIPIQIIGAIVRKGNKRIGIISIGQIGYDRFSLSISLRIGQHSQKD